jgi:glutamine synthetase type III
MNASYHLVSETLLSSALKSLKKSWGYHPGISALKKVVSKSSTSRKEILDKIATASKARNKALSRLNKAKSYEDKIKYKEQAEEMRLRVINLMNKARKFTEKEKRVLVAA